MQADETVPVQTSVEDRCRLGRGGASASPPAGSSVNSEGGVMPTAGRYCLYDVTPPRVRVAGTEHCRMTGHGASRCFDRFKVRDRDDPNLRGALRFLKV